NPVSAADRARIRTEVAREVFRAEHGRDPIDAREIAATIAKGSRPRTHTVAGYDLTFSPVKSVSTLCAVGQPSTERCCSRRRWRRRRPTTLRWNIISATGSEYGSQTGPTRIRASGRY